MSDKTNESREAAIVAFDNEMRDRDIKISTRAHRTTGFGRGYDAALADLVGEPTGEQVRSAALEMHRCDERLGGGMGWDYYIPMARAALTAAGVAPQAPSEGWSTADAREAAVEADSRFSEWRGGERAEFTDGCFNGFKLGAEWWKARSAAPPVYDVGDLADVISDVMRHAPFPTADAIARAVIAHLTEGSGS